MGLDTSHDAWEGSYSTFNEWRNLVARAAGFPPLKEMVGFGGERLWETTSGDKRLIPLLHHSDCDGDIPPEDCAAIADALEELLPRMPKYEDEGEFFHDLWWDSSSSAVAARRWLARGWSSTNAVPRCVFLFTLAK